MCEVNDDMDVDIDNVVDVDVDVNVDIDINEDCYTHLKYLVILLFFILFPRAAVAANVELACTLFENRRCFLSELHF